MNKTASLQDLLNQGSALLERGRLNDAQALAAELVRQLGDNLEVRFFASDVESLRGDAPAALRHLDALDEEQGKRARILLRKAQLLAFDGQRAKALECARAVNVSETDERQRVALARVFLDVRRPAEARDTLLLARERYGDTPAILYVLAVTEAQLDLVDNALQHLEQVLTQMPAHAGALHLRSQLRRWSEADHHIADLRQLAADASEPQLTAVAYYSLGKEQEDLESAEAAFAAYRAGAKAFRSGLAYDSASELAAQEALREHFTAARYAELPPGCEDEAPIFLVGLPRSGLRLVESVLVEHDAVTTAGEAGDFRRIMGLMAKDAAPAEVSDAEATLAVDFAELGRRYLAAVRELADDDGQGASRVLDRTSYNFLYCGHILAALPRARIIHVTRNPLDTSYSLFKTLYFGAHSYSYDLDEIADYVASHYRHMAHWAELFPGRILTVSYEALVTAPESELRRVLEFCELPWDASLLAGVALASTQESGRRGHGDNSLSLLRRPEPFHREAIGGAERLGVSLAGLRSRLEEAGVPV